MIEGGYIKLHRSLLKWEWYDDINTFKLFVHLLLTVNIVDNNWHGEQISRGSRVTSYTILSQETKLSIKQIRVALDKLKTTGEVAVKKCPRYSIISINNFEKYQQRAGNAAPERQDEGRQGAGKGQQYKKVKESIKKEKNNARAREAPDGFSSWEEYEKQIAQLRR